MEPITDHDAGDENDRRLTVEEINEIFETVLSGPAGKVFGEGMRSVERMARNDPLRLSNFFGG